MDGSATRATICIGLGGRAVNARIKGIPLWACPQKLKIGSRAEVYE